jgi:hypothetical protein
MAGAPNWKVYNPAGEYIAACKHVEDAAALAALNGNGTTIRSGHSKAFTVWTEGAESQPAGESYDHVATLAADRLRTINRAYYAKHHGAAALAEVDARNAARDAEKAEG